MVGQADVALLLEVADPWGQFNTVSDPHHEYRRLAKPDVKIIHISLGDTLTKSNYQDMQRFMPVDLPISGDAQATLPALIEAVKNATSMTQRAASRDRATKLREDHRRMKDARARKRRQAGMPARAARRASRRSCTISSRTRNGALPFPACSGTAISGRPRSTINFIGGSGGAGQGYGAPAAVGAALANRDKGIVTVSIEGDGDLMYAPGSLWTAAHHKIPLLMIVHNNRAYHQEVMHLQKMAALHNRRMDTAAIGTTIENPNIDYAKLAQSMGVQGEGPITNPSAIGPALSRALAVVKRGEPALVDVVSQGR